MIAIIWRMKLRSKKYTKRNFEGMDIHEFLKYTPNKKYPIDLIYYNVGKIINHIGIEDANAASDTYYDCIRKIEAYYETRHNWCSLSEAAKLLKCSDKTVKRFFEQGFIRGVINDDLIYQKIKLCKDDIWAFLEEKHGKDIRTQ